MGRGYKIAGMEEKFKRAMFASLRNTNHQMKGLIVTKSYPLVLSHQGKLSAKEAARLHNLAVGRASVGNIVLGNQARGLRCLPALRDRSKTQRNLAGHTKQVPEMLGN